MFNFNRVWGIVSFGLISASVGFALGVAGAGRRLVKKADEGVLMDFVKEQKAIWGIKEE